MTRARRGNAVLAHSCANLKGHFAKNGDNRVFMELGHRRKKAGPRISFWGYCLGVGLGRRLRGPGINILQDLRNSGQWREFRRLGGKGSFRAGKRPQEPPAPVVWGRKPGELSAAWLYSITFPSAKDVI